MVQITFIIIIIIYYSFDAAVVQLCYATLLTYGSSTVIVFAIEIKERKKVNKKKQKDVYYNGTRSGLFCMADK